MIEVSGLSKVYTAQTAVDNITFTVNEGEILGFLGPNGAGKSTVMNIITGYLSPSSGKVTVGGHDILKEPIEAKKLMGYLPERPPLYYDMTVEEYLGFMFDLKKAKEKKKAHLEETMEAVKITQMKDRLIKNLSKGYRQRVGIAQAMLGNPDVLILDEPTVGLDPNQILEIRDLIKRLGKKRTVILSSHILSEVQAVCERVIIINHGKIVADGHPEQLSRNLSKSHDLVVRIKGDEKRIEKMLKVVEGVDKVLLGGKKEENIYEFTLEPVDKKDLREDVFRKMAENNLPILEMRSSQLTLEDVFVKLTSGELTLETEDVFTKKTVLNEEKEGVEA